MSCDCENARMVVGGVICLVGCRSITLENPQEAFRRKEDGIYRMPMEANCGVCHKPIRIAENAVPKMIASLPAS